MNIKKIQLTAVILAGCIAILAWADALYAISVIPGAKGFGMETPAGRGGKIIHVTNLNSSGEGSFRAAIEASGPRIVIFDVSGAIVYKNRYKIKNPYLTIAGQTAPSPGIILNGSTLTIDTHDVLIQHIRVRTGDDPDGVLPDYRDAINIGLVEPPEELYNIVVDHCSASWGIDETQTAGGCSNVTYSNCIISEPLNDSLHSKGEHSKAMVIAQHANNVAYLDNLIAHSADRNPYISYGNNKLVVSNNLIYNPKISNIIIQCGRGPVIASIVGNVVIGGPNSGSRVRETLPLIYNDLISGSKIYLHNNRTGLEQSEDLDDWALIYNKTNSFTDAQVKKEYSVSSPPVWPEKYTSRPSSQVEAYLILNAGARPADRDEVDNRIINDVIHRSGRIIDSQAEVGGWPDLKENKITHDLPANPHGDDDNNGYTNIEEWLHTKAREVEASISTPGNLKIK